MKRKLFLTSLAIVSSLGSFAQSNEMIIQAKKPGAAIQSTMYGIFFEDINYAADGGLYAEMVANRSFEYPNSFACWDISGKVSLKDDGPFDKNPHYVRLSPSGFRDKHTMIENHGFFGMGVKKGASSGMESMKVSCISMICSKNVFHCFLDASM